MAKHKIFSSQFSLYQKLTHHSRTQVVQLFQYSSVCCTQSGEFMQRDCEFRFNSKSGSMFFADQIKRIVPQFQCHITLSFGKGDGLFQVSVGGVGKGELGFGFSQLFFERGGHQDGNQTPTEINLMLYLNTCTQETLKC